MPHADHPNVSNAMSFLYAHPVSADIRARVLSELADIERRHDVRVLFACESGSRGWGFASPDSDYDVRFVYVHRPAWYLSVEPQRDVIEVPISDELDVGGWELRKALQLMHRSNPTLLEWLASPIVYREDPAAVQRMRALAPTFFSERRGRWHYLSMAAKNFRGYLQGETVRLKKYLYVLRPLLAAQWIDAGRGMPPMRFADLADVMVADAPLREEINRLLAIKMASSEAEYGARFPRIHAFVEQALAAQALPADFRQGGGDPAALDAFLYATVMAADTHPS
ncbi:nucleotidyltransferase domain-containing protein [Ralstonia nicotianae]|nr:MULTISPECIES: nucleotidyltransferase domain-containing protein [Ralstonia solanacearum species complex]AXV74413.1 nucleotidyltransferase domain-containing protein [Ralstonia solanacearum]AXW16112.1 nucleotidyltransferase domain-containing protein [Ralstonia solanacearum]AXW39716.1 nucleotidyltransferase domain-containing protein [Ralstonia solanacearum]AXW72489.1 nucleotidyltransferase domain-containing protein [Ralstonia solanacearum]MCK4124582.1 nucleotidyltransferase domain-containing pr